MWSSTPSSRSARVTLEGHGALRVEMRGPEVPDGAVAAQLDMLRERFADLEESGTPRSTATTPRSM